MVVVANLRRAAVWPTNVLQTTPMSLPEKCLPVPRLSIRVSVDAARQAKLDAEPEEPEQPPSRRSPRDGRGLEGDGGRSFAPEAAPDPPVLSLDAWTSDTVAVPLEGAPVVDGKAKTARGVGAPTGCQAAALVTAAPLAELTPAAANAKQKKT